MVCAQTPTALGAQENLKDRMQRVLTLVVHPGTQQKQTQILSGGMPPQSRTQSSPTDKVPREKSNSQSKAIKHTSQGGAMKELGETGDCRMTPTKTSVMPNHTGARGKEKQRLIVIFFTFKKLLFHLLWMFTLILLLERLL